MKKELMLSKEEKDDVYALITYDDGAKIMPLYKGSTNYIMTGDGETFDNVSYK